MAQPIQRVNLVIPDCVSLGIDQGRFSLVFRSKKGADEFDGLFQGLWKADEVMGQHCKSYVPPNFESWNAYAKELGVPTVKVYEVAFDQDLTSDVFASKICSLFQSGQ